jgi:hypothetical protein
VRLRRARTVCHCSHVTVRISAGQPTVRLVSSVRLLTHHWNQPYRGAGRTVLFGLFVLCLFVRQHMPDVQFASDPVA